MQRFACLITLATLWLGAGDSHALATTLVRAKPDGAITTRERPLAEVISAYHELAAANVTDVVRAERERVIDERCDRAVTPCFDELLEVAATHPDDLATVEILGFSALNSGGPAE